jgi:hypothetical protein
MLRRAVLPALLILLSATLTLAADDLNGRWEGSMSTPNGDFALTFNFKVDGKTLTGTVETAEGSLEITDGKVDGDKSLSSPTRKTMTSVMRDPFRRQYSIESQRPLGRV